MERPPAPVTPAEPSEPQEPAVPEPAAEPHELFLSDEALAVDAGGGAIAVLARRSFWVFRGDGRLVGAADLSDWLPAREALPRRAMGRLVPSGDRSWDIWSTSLGVRQVLRVVLDDGGTPTAGPVDVDPPEERAIGISRGWRGPVVELPASDGTTFFHLDEDGGLVAESMEGEVLDRVGPVGEPLSVRPSSGGARIYASSPSIPGEADRIIEYGWDGTALIERRRSRAFVGRIAAIAFHDGNGVVAVVERPGDTRLHQLTEKELWAEAP